MCLHEEDHGLLWKHVEYRTGHNESRRSRRLVLSFIATVANYEYGFYWYLYQVRALTPSSAHPSEDGLHKALLRPAMIAALPWEQANIALAAAEHACVHWGGRCSASQKLCSSPLGCTLRLAAAASLLPVQLPAATELPACLPACLPNSRSHGCRTAASSTR